MIQNIMTSENELLRLKNTFQKYKGYKTALGNIRLVVTDMDNTFLGLDHKATQENREAVQNLRDKGVAVIFASGRMDKMLLSFAQSISMDLPIISDNGALIRFPDTNTPLRFVGLEQQASQNLAEHFYKEKRDFIIYTKNSVYYPEWSERIKRFYHYNALAIGEGIEPILLHSYTDKASFTFPEDPVKFFVGVDDDEDLKKVNHLISELSDFNAVLSLPKCLDVMASGIEKGEALAYLAKYLDLKPEEILCLGDHQNDCSLLGFTPNSFAMANAEPELKKIASFQFEHHNCSAFSRMVKQFFY